MEVVLLPCDIPRCRKPALKFGLVAGLRVKACGRHLKTLPPQDLYDIEAYDFLLATESEAREIAQNYANRATEKSKKEDFQEAVVLWKRTVYLMSLRFPRDRLTAVANHSFGSLLYCEWQQFDEAEKALRLSLEIESEFDSNSEGVIQIGMDLGVILAEAGKYTEAALVLTHTVEVSKTHFPGQKRTYTAQRLLSSVYWKLGQREAALELVTVCCTGGLRDYPLSKSTALSLLASGSYAKEMKDYKTVENRFKTALSIVIPHSNAELLIECFDSFKNLYHDMDTESAMEELLRDARLSERQRDPTSLASKYLRKQLEFYYTPLDDNQMIELMYQEELEFCRTHEIKSEYMFEVVEQLIEIYDNQGREEETKPLYEEAVSIGRTQNPVPMTALKLMRELADLYNDDDRTSEAEALYQEAFASSKAISLTFTSTIDALKDLADFYESHGRSSEAETSYIEVIETVRKEPIAKGALVAWLSCLESFYEKQSRLVEQALVCKEIYDLNREKSPISTPTNVQMYSLMRIYKELGWDSQAEKMLKLALYTAQSYDPALYDFIVNLTRKFPPPGVEETEQFSNLKTFYEETYQYAEAEYCYLHTAQDQNIKTVCLIQMRELRKLYTERNPDFDF